MAAITIRPMQRVEAALSQWQEIYRQLRAKETEAVDGFSRMSYPQRKKLEAEIKQLRQDSDAALKRVYAAMEAAKAERAA